MIDFDFLNNLKFILKNKLSTGFNLLDDYFDLFFLLKSYHSSKIFGCNFSFDEAKEFLVNGNIQTGKDFLDYLVLQNIYDAQNWFNTSSESNNNFLSVSSLKKINNILLNGIDYRKKIVAGKCLSLKICKGDFRGAKNHLKTNTDIEYNNISKEIENLFDTFYYKNDFDFYYFAYFYHSFLKIRPFDMANGRTLRIIFDIPMRKSNYFPILFTNRNSDLFNNALSEAKSNNYKPLEILIFKKVCESYKMLINYLDTGLIEEFNYDDILGIS